MPSPAMDINQLLSTPGVLRNRLLLIALWFVFYGSFTLLTPPLLDDADSVHAEVAREMLLRHDGVTLYANGIRYLEKAPLLYWSMATSFKLFGVHTAAARLPLAFTVLALALALESFGRRAFARPKQQRSSPEHQLSRPEPDRSSPEQERSSQRAGLYAGLLLLSSFGIFIFTRITIPDALVCLWLTLALFCYWLTEQPCLLDHRHPPDPPAHESGSPASSLPSGLSDPGSPAASSARSSPHLRLLCWAFAACCALNVLTKGLIGIVFPLAIVLAHLLVTRRTLGGVFTRIRQLSPLSSIAVFLTIAAPWHVLIALANPTQGHPGGLTFTHAHWALPVMNVPLPTDGNVHGWLWFYFVNEQLLRYLNLRVPRDYDTVPLALFWGLLLVWLMPWSAFLWHSLEQVPWRKALRLRISIRTLTPQESTRLLLGLWALLPLLFFSFSTRQEYYVLPALPPLILLIAAWLSDEAAEAESFTVPNPLVHAGQRISVALLTAGSVAAMVAGFFLLHAHSPGPNTDLASLLRQNPGDYALSFGHLLDLNAQAMGAFRTPLFLTAIAVFGGTLANWLCRHNYRPHAGNLWLAAAAFTFLFAAHLGLQIFSPVLTSQQLAAAIGPLLKPDDLIVIHGEYESASTLSFYLRRPGAGSGPASGPGSGSVSGSGSDPQAAADPTTEPLHLLDGRSSNLWYGSFFPDAPPIFEDDVSLSLQWTGVRRIFLWQDLGQHLPSLPGKAYFIAQIGGKEIVSNQPNPR